MSEVTSIAALRAERNQDSTLWTAEDLVNEVQQELATGKIKPEAMIVMWLEKTSTGAERQMMFSGLTRMETVAMLSAMLHDAIHDWTGR